jgi:nitrite reductase/ring-hydroxylating ferredoxin subunit
MSNQARSMQKVRLDLFRRILTHAESRTTELAPDVMHFDVATFLDSDRFAREQRRLFRETPLVACLSSDLPEPGSYRLFEDAGVPIVVVRGKDGGVRAFLNICAHRGARLYRQPRGNALRVTCRFHGWTYDATGKVIGVPKEEDFCGRIERQKRLVSCPAEERHGLVFVQATPDSTMDLSAHLGAFAEELEVLELGKAFRVLEDDIHSPSNWKYALDTYFENYHLPVLHAKSFAKIFASDLCLFDTWGPHHRFTFPHRTIRDWIGKPESEWPIDSLPFTYFLFPNTVISVGSVSSSGALISIHRLFPLSVGELINRMTIYAPHGVRSPEHLAEIEASFESIKRAVADEDYSVTGESYRALTALPPGTNFVFGRHEIGPQNLHRHIDRLVGER